MNQYIKIINKQCPWCSEPVKLINYIEVTETGDCTRHKVTCDDEICNGLFTSQSARTKTKAIIRYNEIERHNRS